ncbi:peptide MFS transporter [Jiulongibacter sp. NS-SX5]|uniref:peptide MFS transporter n=1 Tax=Jiulongibacter sp. NS-SX5 TaxID=3463854 RepID=UPI00405890FB
MSVKEKTLFGHPLGLYVLFFTEMWERFSYYGMRAILLLFLLDSAQGGLGLNEGDGGAVYGLYTASVYLLSLPGGWVADNVIGQRKAIWWGGIVIMIGHIILAFPAGQMLFFLGLAVVAFGTGLLKPNISTVVSELYPEGGGKRDAAFSIFYMGINLGSLLGITIVGYLGQKVGWHYGFGAAAVAMFLGLVVYKIFANKYLGDKGMHPKAKDVSEGDDIQSKNKTLTYILFGIYAVAIIGFQVTGLFEWGGKEEVVRSIGIIIATLLPIYFLNMIFASGLTPVEQRRVGVLVVLFIGAVAFWAGFEQQGSTLQIFADRHSELPFGMPSSWFQNFNAAFILMFAPVVGALWVFLDKRNINFSAPAKFGVALLLLAFGYWIMVKGAEVAVTGVKASAMFLTLTYLFHTLGELFLSPVGLSTFTKLAPKKFLSQLMGIWFVATSMGNLIGGLFAGNFDEGNLAAMPELFMSVVWATLIIGVIILLLSKPISKMMGGIK